MTTVVITIDGQNVDLALNWAKEFCPSYITNTGRIEGSRPGDAGGYPVCAAIYYDFIFSDQHDAAMFALKWS
jgi:hypothetical protein